MENPACKTYWEYWTTARAKRQARKSIMKHLEAEEGRMDSVDLEMIRMAHFIAAGQCVGMAAFGLVCSVLFKKSEFYRKAATQMDVRRLAKLIGILPGVYGLIMWQDLSENQDVYLSLKYSVIRRP